MNEIAERNKKELNVFKYGYLSWRSLGHLFENIKQFFRNIKYAWQRATRGYCDYDLFSMDSYYLQLFYHTLKDFARNVHGYPGFDIFTTTEDSDGYKNWITYLSEMADHFENAQEWNEDIQMNKDVKALYDKMDQYVVKMSFVKDDEHCGFSRLEYTYSDEEAHEKAKEEWSNKVKEASDYRENEKDIAFDMMKKFFFCLWD